MPPQDATKPPQDGSYREQPGSQNGGGKAVQLIPRRAALARRRDEYAAEHEALLRAFFDRQERSLRSKRAGHKAALEQRWTRELAADLEGLAHHIVAREGGVASARMGQADFDAGRTAHYLAQKAKGTAEGINRTTSEQLASGDAVEVFAQARDNRAAAAGLEAATSLVAFAVREAVAQAPDTERRMISISGGECQICAPYQGEWAASDVPGWPAYHPSCNCVAEVF
jgi:hypothetical protein